MKWYYEDIEEDINAFEQELDHRKVIENVKGNSNEFS